MYSMCMYHLLYLHTYHALWVVKVDFVLIFLVTLLIQWFPVCI